MVMPCFASELVWNIGPGNTNYTTTVLWSTNRVYSQADTNAVLLWLVRNLGTTNPPVSRFDFGNLVPVSYGQMTNWQTYTNLPLSTTNCIIPINKHLPIAMFRIRLDPNPK